MSLKSTEHPTTILHQFIRGQFQGEVLEKKVKRIFRYKNKKAEHNGRLHQNMQVKLEIVMKHINKEYVPNIRI